MASRRDQLLATVGNLHDQINNSIRSPDSAARGSSNIPNYSNNSGGRGGGSTSPPRNRLEGQIVNQLGRGFGAIQRGISGLELNTDNTFTAPHAISRSPEQSASSAFAQNPLSRENSATTAAATPAASGSGQEPELPSYTRREGGQDVVQSEFHYASKSGKLAARVIGSGSQPHPVYMPDLFDQFAGDVYVRLDKPEAISAVRVRLKCCLTACVLANIPGQPGPPRPMTQEVLLLDETQTLWQASSHDSRVEGTRQFRFSMKFPNAILWQGNRHLLPPSFQIGDVSKFMEGASIKYYAKIVLARQGLLNPNERIIFPIIYLPLVDRQPELVTRSQIYQHTRTLPSPVEDPTTWTGQQSKQDVVSSGSGSGGMGMGSLFGKKSGGGGKNKTGWAEYVALVPSPAVFDRHTPLMCYVKVTSSDLGVTGNIKSNCVSAKLIQSVMISAQGCSSQSENVVATFDVSSESRDEASQERSSQGVVSYSNIFRGSLDLPVLPITFTAPHITTAYALIFDFKLPYVSKYSLKVPIKIISTLAPTPSRPVPQPSASQRQTPTKAQQAQDELAQQQQQQQQSSSSSSSPGYAPPAGDPPQSLRPGFHGAQSNQQPSQESQQQQQAYEQEVPDMPPSYWEVVEQGQRMDRPVRRSRYAVV